MNIRKFVTGSVAALALFAGVTLGVVNKAQAAQIPWTGGNLPSISEPVFNTYTNLPNGIGNEADFVRLRTSNGNPQVPNATNNFVDPVNAECNVGDMFDIRTYVHNGASAGYNDNGNGSSVAHGVTVSMTAPLGETDDRFVFRSTISANNAETVTDDGVLNCENDVRLRLVPSTVYVYSLAYGWQQLGDSTVNGGSFPIGSQVPGSGDVWGCWNDRVIVVYTVEVVEVPAEPVYSCDLLVAQALGERRFRYTVRYTARNGATFKNVKFNFGDNTPVVTTTSTTAEHKYAKDGTYNTRATVTFTVNGQDVTSTGNACVTNVTASTPKDYCPIPGKTHLPANSPECKETPKNNCLIPGKTHLPVDSPECKLPETGMGEVYGLFTATTLAGTAAHKVFSSRRSRGL